MMNKHSLFLLLFLTHQLFFAQSVEIKIQHKLDSIYKANPKSIGIMLHVESPKNNISWNTAVGYSNKVIKQKIESDQPVLIASSIKSYVSVSILRLVEKNKVRLDQSLNELLTTKTKKRLKNNGYELDSIKLKHLLSHTSGIADYVNDDYFDFVTKNKSYRWTRNEQIKLAMKVGQPLAKPGEHFSYADVNYLLATEIIENATKKPFYTAMKELLRYDEIGLYNTWFPTLENKPKNTKNLVHQYFTEKKWDSYDIDISWDLFGGGGIATTTSDLAKFSHHFFNQKIVKDRTVKKQTFTEIRTKEREFHPYFLGFYQDYYNGMSAYGHGGFWGSQVLYFPLIDTSISIAVLERDRRAIIRVIMNEVTKILKDEFLKYKNKQLKNYLKNITDFSGTILIAHKDSIIQKKQYGLASIEFNVKNNLETKFNIASITKMITSVATLQLVEQGKINLTKTVGDYLPNYPHKLVRDSVTIHQLLTHTSGLKPFYGGKYLTSDKLIYTTVNDYAKLFNKDSLQFKPGSQYYYNGSGFVVLGLIIEKITGQNYYDYIKKNIVEKAAMKNTLAFKTDAIIKNKATGYTSLFGNNDYFTRNEYYISKASPAGGYFSTIDDLYRFSKALRTYKLLKKETFNLMTTAKVHGFNTHLGYGIDIDKRYYQRIIGHSGGWFGVRTELMDFLASDYTIVVLSNKDDNGKTGASKVIDDLKEIIAGKKRGTN